MDNRFYSEAIEAAGAAGCWSWSSEGDTFMLDQGASRLLFGDDALGDLEIPRRDTLRQLHADDKDWVERLFASKVREGGPLSMEFRVVSPSRGTRWLMSKGSFQLNGSKGSGAGILLDITESRADSGTRTPETEIATPLEHAADLCLAAHGALGEVGSPKLLHLLNALLFELGRELAARQMDQTVQLDS